MKEKQNFKKKTQIKKFFSKKDIRIKNKNVLN